MGPVLSVQVPVARRPVNGTFAIAVFKGAARAAAVEGRFEADGQAFVLHAKDGKTYGNAYEIRGRQLIVQKFEDERAQTAFMRQ